MLGIAAVVIAAVFVGMVLYRLFATENRVFGIFTFDAALVATAAGAAHWWNGADSRWIVGALLLAFAAPVTVFSAGSRGLKIGAAVLGVAGFALYAIAFATRG